MKKITTSKKKPAATIGNLDVLLGQRVMLLCLNYIYSGVLKAIEHDRLVLAEPSIVYETGPWDTNTYSDTQRLPCELLYVQRGAIEAFGIGK
jgi:hypothetical protein